MKFQKTNSNGIKDKKMKTTRDIVVFFGSIAIFLAGRIASAKSNSIVVSTPDGNAFLVISKTKKSESEIVKILEANKLSVSQAPNSPERFISIEDKKLTDAALDIQDILGGKTKVNVVPLDLMALSDQAGGPPGPSFEK